MTLKTLQARRLARFERKVGEQGRSRLQICKKGNRFLVSSRLKIRCESSSESQLKTERSRLKMSVTNLAVDFECNLQARQKVCLQFEQSGLRNLVVKSAGEF